MKDRTDLQRDERISAERGEIDTRDAGTRRNLDDLDTATTRNLDDREAGTTRGVDDRDARTTRNIDEPEGGSTSGRILDDTDADRRTLGDRGPHDLDDATTRNPHTTAAPRNPDQRSPERDRGDDLAAQSQTRGSAQSADRGVTQDAAAGATTGEAGIQLLAAEALTDFRTRWEQVQVRFVDQPRDAVQSAHDLVGELVDRLSESFTKQRNDLEGGWGRGEDDTEALRLALQRYRSFFNRLLST